MLRKTRKTISFSIQNFAHCRCKHSEQPEKANLSLTSSSCTLENASPGRTPIGHTEQYFTVKSAAQDGYGATRRRPRGKNRSGATATRARGLRGPRLAA